MLSETLNHLRAENKRCTQVFSFLIATGLAISLTTGFTVPRTTQERNPSLVVGKHIPVTVRNRKSHTTVLAQHGETVAQVLERLHITVGVNDILNAEPELPAADTDIWIARDAITYVNETEAIPFETVRRENPSLYRGTEQTVQKGVDGERILRYRTVTLNGQSDRTLINEEVTHEPMIECVEYGTKARPVKRASLGDASNAPIRITEKGNGGGVIETASGSSLAYTKVLSVTATAYTTERQSWKKTATGTIARVGAIAVDPAVIPYGTQMYIQTSDGDVVYGVATAEDCGGAIKGNKIDLFFDTYDECIKFGVRRCTVYILA